MRAPCGTARSGRSAGATGPLWTTNRPSRLIRAEAVDRAVDQEIAVFAGFLAVPIHGFDKSAQALVRARVRDANRRPVVDEAEVHRPLRRPRRIDHPGPEVPRQRVGDERHSRIAAVLGIGGHIRRDDHDRRAEAGFAAPLGQRQHPRCRFGLLAGERLRDAVNQRAPTNAGRCKASRSWSKLSPSAHR